ncbi:MAG: glutamine--fructose-6-phosphate transaminase (isomerizing) [Acidobacteriota bacterium]|nr:glutamine--fructose-6-phosphate transaminase (isomerizing) [Acidobacteriota bacterium]
MCGIVGYVGNRSAQALLLAGLRRLEYRGYDSAGIAVLAGDRIVTERAVGNLEALSAKLSYVLDEGESGGGRASGEAASGEAGAVAVAQAPAADAFNSGTTGIGHTRWATHGRVSEENAHPHDDSDGRIYVVVNGIVENYLDLKERLQAGGATFSSETDAEAIAHLVASHYAGDLTEAVRSAYGELVGHYAFVAMCVHEPHTLVAVRRECPLVIGRGDGEQFVASAIPAFLSETRSVQYLENGEIATLRPGSVSVQDAAGEPVEREVQEVDWDEEAVEKGGYETFMLKEIYEQADAVAETILGHLQSEEGVALGMEGALGDEELERVGRIVLVACGTSYHAGLVGRYVIEQWARVPVEIDIASEYRYRDSVVGADDLVIGISQSGETADTLAAMRYARERGARVLTITNVVGSQATRDADGVLFTRAGMEVGVAATKTFVCQVALISLLALRLAELRGTLTPDRVAELAGEMRRLPHRIAEVTGSPGEAPPGSTLGRVRSVAEAHFAKDFFLYIGRNVGLPVALEGALKLKEISYIATDAYAAGEMKHGPIALLDESTPVVCIATRSPVLDKMTSNMQEVRARGAYVVAICTEGDEGVAPHADVAIPIPPVDPMLQPMLAVIPLQLLAYEIARRRGLNVDQPRNLAKTVTVE